MNQCCEGCEDTCGENHGCRYASCPCHVKATHEVEGWEKEFDKEFVRDDGLLNIGKYDEGRVAEFIASLLKGQQDRIVSELEGMKSELPWSDRKYNQALTDAIAVVRGV